MKPRAFFYHYNKPASRAAGKPQLSIHYGGKCCIVDAIRCEVPTETRIRKTQPYCVVAGRGILIIEDMIATLKAELN